MKEIWKWIDGYEGKYEISNTGRVRSHYFLEPTILRTYVSCHGYLGIKLAPRKKGQTCLVHRMVADAFLPNPDSLPIVHHKDGNRKNAHVSNLEWVSSSQNTIYAYQSGRLVSPLKKLFGERAPTAKLKEIDVLAIREALATTDISMSELARQYGMSQHAISDIRTRHSWKHI